MDKQLVVSVVLWFSLVVELKEIEIDQIAHLLVNCDIGSIRVEGIFEVRSLRAVGHNFIRNDLSKRLCEFNDPILPSSHLHSAIVLLTSRYQHHRGCLLSQSFLILLRK